MKIRIGVFIHPLAVFFACLGCFLYLTVWCVRAAVLLLMAAIGGIVS